GDDGAVPLRHRHPNRARPKPTRPAPRALVLLEAAQRQTLGALATEDLVEAAAAQARAARLVRSLRWELSERGAAGTVVAATLRRELSLEAEALLARRPDEAAVAARAVADEASLAGHSLP
ncbi:MAG: hypothetical protein ACYCWW_19070, partial [Deltaproteobacteria bacterium]